MKFFVDTADIKQIEELIPTGFVNGVTTNPSLIAKNGDDMAKTIKAICSIVSGPVSAEVTATDYDTMMQEGEYLASLAKNVAVKVPLTPSGLRTCKTLREREILVNVTLCFTAAQALLAAKKLQKTIDDPDAVPIKDLHITLASGPEWKKMRKRLFHNSFTDPKFRIDFDEVTKISQGSRTSWYARIRQQKEM